MAKQLLVESIRTDGGTQSRERINEEVVAEYAEALLRQGYGGQAMKAAPGSRPGQPWPPVRVFFDGTEYWMVDGFHRLAALRKIGRKHVAAEVKRGTREEAAWEACAANQAHGLRRTNADKRKAVEIGLKLHPEMTDGAIAEHCGLSQPFVGAMRRQVITVMTSGPPARRIGRDGKSYPAPPPPPPRRREAPAAGPPPCPNERNASVTVGSGQLAGGSSQRAVGTGQLAGGRSQTASAKGPQGPVDNVGRRIPDHLLELWGRRAEVQEMVTALSRVRVALAKAQDRRDPLFSEIPYSSALAHLDQAYDTVQVAKPYAVCAFCQGHGCKVCGQRGLLGKFRWDTAVPKEMKEAVGRLAASGQ